MRIMAAPIRLFGVMFEQKVVAREIIDGATSQPLSRCFLGQRNGRATVRERNYAHRGLRDDDPTDKQKDCEQAEA